MKTKLAVLATVFMAALGVYSVAPASAIYDPGMEGAGGGCPGHVEWVCYWDDNSWNIYCQPEWVREC